MLFVHLKMAIVLFTSNDPFSLCFECLKSVSLHNHQIVFNLHQIPSKSNLLYSVAKSVAPEIYVHVHERFLVMMTLAEFLEIAILFSTFLNIKICNLQALYRDTSS